MTTDYFRALVVEDEDLYARAISKELGRQGIGCDVAVCGEDALLRTERGKYQLILLDHRLPDDDGINMIPLLLAKQPQAALVMMTAYHAIPNAVRAIRQGAEDYIVKETSIQPIVSRALEIRERFRIRQNSDGWQDHKRTGLIGNSAPIRAVVDELNKIAKSPDTTVLLTGETGVGKEVAARYLHQVSSKHKRPLVNVDCLAMPPTLAESLLFGHEKGVFTGAEISRMGAFEEAGSGTIFLDEIGDVGELQGKLLRVLESRRFKRIGSLKELPLRARVIGATNRDLEAMVGRGEFRRDLYERLSVFPIHLPPLRERSDDIFLLADHFREFFAQRLHKAVETIGDSVRHQLAAYGYPGNVRELKNIIERAVIICDSGRLELRHLPQRVLDASRPTKNPMAIPISFVPGIDSLEALEKRMIRQAMKRSANVKAEAARLLGISRYQLIRRMDKYRIKTNDDAVE